MEPGETPHHSTSAHILCVISGDLTSNRGRIIGLFACRTHFIQYSITISPPIGSSTFMSSVVTYNALKCDPELNRSRKIRFPSRRRRQLVWPEVASDVISGAVVEEVSIDACVKFGVTSSNHSRDIGPVHFVTYDDDHSGVAPRLMVACTYFLLVICIYRILGSW